MDKKQLLKIIKEMQLGKEITLSSDEFDFGITKQNILENNYICFGFYGGDIKTIITMHNTAEEITEKVIKELESETGCTLNDFNIASKVI